MTDVVSVTIIRDSVNAFKTLLFAISFEKLLLQQSYILRSCFKRSTWMRGSPNPNRTKPLVPVNGLITVHLFNLTPLHAGKRIAKPPATL